MLNATHSIQLKFGSVNRTDDGFMAYRYYQAADIWAFGIMLMELATGHAPYANFSLTNIIIMTMHSPVPQLERSFSDVMRTALVMMHSCMTIIHAFVRACCT